MHVWIPALWWASNELSSRLSQQKVSVPFHVGMTQPFPSQLGAGACCDFPNQSKIQSAVSGPKKPQPTSPKPLYLREMRRLAPFQTMLHERALLPFLFLMFCLIVRWLQSCTWERTGVVISKPLFTLAFSTRPPSTHCPALQTAPRQGGMESSPGSTFCHEPAARPAPRCQDLNTCNTPILQKAAKTRATNSHQKLSQYPWSHTGVCSARSIAPGDL